MNELIKIFRLREQDIPEVLSIADVCGLSPWSAEAYRDEIGRADSIGLCARFSNSLAGFIIGRLVPASSALQGPDAEIFNIGVKPEYMRRGYGNQLIDHFIKDCVNYSVYSIWLEVRAANDSAIQFYERHQFVDSYRRKAFYSSPPDDAIVMKLQLLDLTTT
ncbi:MAG: ribosomal protein S18-alanine N-acetyltransferase [Acidobacteriota bacterium]